MAKKPRSIATLERVVKKLAKTKPEKAHSLAFEAFEVAALAGDVASARKLLDALFSLPALKQPVHALSTHAVDVYCAAAGFGDLGKGKPAHTWALVHDGTLPERVTAIERGVRARIAMDAYSDEIPIDDRWRTMKRADPMRQLGRWRTIQQLAHPERATQGTLRDAFTRMDELLADWPADERGAGYGRELVLALDLALRQGERETADRWLAAHGQRVHDESLFFELVCHPTVATAMVEGFFRRLETASSEDLTAHLDAVAAALRALATTADAARPKTEDRAKPPKVQRRRVSAEYSQVHLEPAERDAAEREQVFFQVKGDGERGMSLFATMVGIATPSDTEYVDTEIRFEAKAPRIPPPAAVQAVAFPLRVRGPLVLRSATQSEDDDEPFDAPPGDYDVLAAFHPPKTKPKKRDPLRRFRLEIVFCPTGSLGAPKCIRLEDG